MSLYLISLLLYRPAAQNSADTVSLIGRDFLTLKHFTPTEIETLLWTAKDLKVRIKDGQVSLILYLESDLFND